MGECVKLLRSISQILIRSLVLNGGGLEATHVLTALRRWDCCTVRCILLCCECHLTTDVMRCRGWTLCSNSREQRVISDGYSLLLLLTNYLGGGRKGIASVYPSVAYLDAVGEHLNLILLLEQIFVES